MHCGNYQSRRKQVGLLGGAALLVLSFAGNVSAQDAPPAEEAAPAAEAAPVEEAAPAAEAAPEATAAVNAEGVQAAATGDAAAPEEPVAAADDVEEIVVTGSRIGRNNADSYANIAVIQSEDIQMSGVTNVEDFLRRMPALTLQGFGKQNNYSGGGSSSVDLRNLGSGRTLVLVDGKREVSGDMGAIPMGMVERIEILLDGASAVYGSDAVAGVVNIVMKNDFEGYRATVSAGTSTRGDGQQIMAEALVGGNFERGNFALSVGYAKNWEIEELGRSWAHPSSNWQEVSDDNGNGIYEPDLGEGIIVWGSTNTPAGIATMPTGSQYWGDRYTFGTDGSVQPFDSAASMTYVTDPYGPSLSENDDESLGFLNANQRYYWSNGQFLQGRTERFNINARGTYEISEYVDAFVQGDYSHRTSMTRLAPGNLTGPTPYISSNTVVPGNNPYVPDDLGSQLFPGEGIKIQKRFGDAGLRRSINAADIFRISTGLKGRMFERSGWDAFLNYGRITSTGYTQNGLNLRALATALDPEACANDAMCPGVVNMFGEGTMSDDHIKFLSDRSPSYSFYDMLQTGLSANGQMFELPGGYLTGALGGDFRWERGYDLPSGRTSSFEGEGASQYAAGDFNVQEFFAELSAPIFKGLPGMEELTIDLAARVSNYNTFGAAFTYRGGLAYAPIKDIKFRGVYSTAFRAPGIYDLYGGTANGFPIVRDPCNGWNNADPTSDLYLNCQAEGVTPGYQQPADQIKSQSGSNPKLKPEESTQINIGTVISPTFIPKAAGSLMITGDFYKITVDKAISSIDPQSIVNACYNSPGMTHDYCQYLTGRLDNSNMDLILTTLVNAYKIETKGIDFTVNYSLPLPADFAVDLNFQGNILMQFDVNTGEVVDDRLGTLANISDYDGSFAKFRFTANLSLSWKNFGLHNTVRYLGPVEYFKWDGGTPDDITDDLPLHEYDAVAYWNLSASVNWNKLDFSVGMDNVLDKKPAFIPGGDGNSNPNTYDFVGRYVFATASYKF